MAIHERRNSSYRNIFAADGDPQKKERLEVLESFCIRGATTEAEENVMLRQKVIMMMKMKMKMMMMMMMMTTRMMMTSTTTRPATPPAKQRNERNKQDKHYKQHKESKHHNKTKQANLFLSAENSVKAIAITHQKFTIWVWSNFQQTKPLLKLSGVKYFE